MAVSDVVQVRFYCTKSQQTGINVVHYKITSEATGGALMIEIADYFANLGDAHYPDLLDSSAVYRGSQTQKVLPLPKGASTVATLSSAGLVGGDDLPSQVSGLISCRGSLAGRRHRGRMYIPFPSEGSNDATGVPSVAYQNDLQALAAAVYAIQTIVGAGGTTVMKPVILHRLDGTTVDVVESRRRTKWATQRRRGDFGAINPYNP